MVILKLILNLSLIINTKPVVKESPKENKVIEEKQINFVIEEVKENIIEDEKETEEIKEEEQNAPQTVVNTNGVKDESTGTVTAYTAFCEGCSGITASGYNVINTIYYYDSTYGNIRIIAADQSLPFGTIVRMTNTSYGEIIAIVLDRGGAISSSGSAQADLLVETTNDAINFGRQYNINFEILRYGY